MENDFRKKGVQYDAPAGSVGMAVKKMLEIAKNEDAFCYAEINGATLIVEPEMSFDEGIDALQDVRAGKIKIAFHDTRDDFSAGDTARGMEKLAKENDFVISTVNGTTFRIKKGMTADEALDALDEARHGKKQLSEDNSLELSVSELKAIKKNDGKE